MVDSTLCGCYAIADLATGAPARVFTFGASCSSVTFNQHPATSHAPHSGLIDMSTDVVRPGSGLLPKPPLDSERSMMRSFLCALAAIPLLAAPAAAQSPRPGPFASVNFGYQAQSQDFTQTGEFPLFEETGTFDVPQSLEGGGFFEIGGGIGIRRNVSVGASYAIRSKSTRDVQINASVPSPAFPDEFRNATATVSGLERTERAFHLQAIWHVPVTVEFDVAVFAGPSFFSVKDDLIEGFTPTEVGGDFTQVTLENITRSRQSETAVGFNLGVDGRYMLTRNVGAGAMLRYTHGSVDLTSPTSGGEFKSDTGGLEIAGGLRFKF